MSQTRADIALQAQRIAEAAAWQMRLREADLQSTSEFEGWLKDADNAAAWAQAIAMWDFLGDQAREPEIVAAREGALGRVRRTMIRRRARFDWRRFAAAAAVAILALAGGWGGLRWLSAPDDYTTAFGERRVVTLADGSHVSLDSDSEVTVRYSRTARELNLVKGQARFDVAHDVQRPFSVLAGNQKIVATGTAFNIDLTQPKVLVTLIEGHVVIFDEDRNAIVTDSLAVSPSRAPASIELHAGQQLIATRAHPPRIEAANVQRATAWTAGQLIFSDEPLAEVVARVSHYSATPIVISDPGLGEERVTGVFNTGDVAGFLDIVTQGLPIRATTDAQGEIVLKRRS
ncbi:MAG: FecR domain-containing protein [Rhizomicrobium sp.]